MITDILGQKQGVENTLLFLSDFYAQSERLGLANIKILQVPANFFQGQYQVTLIWSAANFDCDQHPQAVYNEL